MRLLGIDIGGTGIKGAPVDLEKGKLAAERFRVETPAPATPEAVLDAIGQIVEHFAWKGPIGCTFPGVVRNGEIRSAVHLDESWMGAHFDDMLREKFGQPAIVMNDADAAALAEVKFGAGKGEQGIVMMVTLGTGIGTGLVYRGVLIPNTELGHLPIKGKDAEERASNSAREEKDMSWKKWAKNVSKYLSFLESFMNPDLYIIGGGVVKEADKFIPRLKNFNTPVVPARLGNEAGIVGAALARAALKPSNNGSRKARL